MIKVKMCRRALGVTLTAGVCLAAVGSVSASWAQEATQAGSGTESSSEIVVTATKRATKLQTTPITVTALSGNNLTQLGATQFSDVVRSVPGLQVNEVQVGQRRLTVRGVQSAGEATVGLYYDETPVTGSSSATNDPSGATPDLNMFDVERVEVLRGPQGTLFGSGSMSGTMRVIFKKPDASAYSGLIDTSVSGTNEGGESYTAKGMVNIPLIEGKLAARAILYREERAGWIDNTYLNQKDINSSGVEGGRIAFQYTPGDRLKLSTSYAEQTTTVDDASAFYPAVGEYKTDNETKIPFNSTIRLYNITGNYDFDFATLTATASRVSYDGTRYIDSTRAARVALNNGTYCSAYTGITTTCNATQRAAYKAWGLALLPLTGYQPMEMQNDVFELRLSSAAGGAFDWTIGAFYEDRGDYSVSSTARADPATGVVLSPLIFVGSRSIQVDQIQKAAFGELTYHVTDKLSVTGGARYYSYDKVAHSQVLATSYINGSIAGPASINDQSVSGWVKKLNVSYNVTRAIMVYGTYSEGFRPGGINNVPGLTAAEIPYSPDSLKNYELGAKTAWFDNKLIANAAIYRIDWDNMQISANSKFGPYRYLTNVGASRIEGLEFEGSYRFTPSLTLSGNFNKLFKSELMENQVSASATAAGLKGDQLPFEPTFTAALALDYRKPVGLTLSGIFHADYSYTGKSFSTLRPTDAFYEQSGNYSLVNLRAGVENADWGLFLTVRNVFDIVGNVRVISGTGSEQATNSTQPRTVGINLRKTF